MDPKVEKLLEGKSDEEKFLAIAYSFGCLLTRPQVNSQCDSPMKGKAYSVIKKVIVVSILCSCSRESIENRIYPSLTDEPVAKKKVNREPKYCFDEVSDEEDCSGKNTKLIDFTTDW